ncbi:unnamed protein product [Rhodiola kirilowii]
MNFMQMDGETLYDAWERYKEYQRLCPHHNLDPWLLFHTFYNGIDGPSRLALDTAAGGAIMELKPPNGYEVIEKITRNDFMWASEKGNTRTQGGRHKVKAIGSSNYDSLTKMLGNLSEKVDRMQTRVNNRLVTRRCDICEVDQQDTDSCLLVQPNKGGFGYGEANFAGKNQERNYGIGTSYNQNSNLAYPT